MQGNGFYDPYSAYLNIKFQFNVVGEFAYDSPTEPFFTQCRAVFTTNNTVKQNLSVITDDYVKIEPALEYEVNGNDHARAFRTTSLKFVQLISIDDIST